MSPDKKPHDKFFKETFSQIDITGDFLRVQLPDTLTTKLDFSSLRREADSYTDEQLSEHFADLVFSAIFDGQPVRVALLLEHKSYTEEHIHFQLNRYILNLWESQVKQKQPLTPVLPIVIYHGKRSWKKQPFGRYFGQLVPELTPYQPAFDYVLIDLSVVVNRLSEFATDYARLTALLLHNSRKQVDMLRVLTDYADAFRQMAEQEAGRRYVETAFVYVYWTTDLTKVEVIAIFQRISAKTGTIAMSTAQRFINEGIEQGIEQGVRAMLKLNMDAATIAAAFELPLAQVERLIEKINGERA